MGRDGQHGLRYAKVFGLLVALAACEAGADPSTPTDGGALALDGSGAHPAEDAGADAATWASDAGGGDEAGEIDAGAADGGRMAGMMEAHNEVRSAVGVTPALPALVWRDDLATYAQAWADHLAGAGCTPAHRTAGELQARDYGENVSFLPARFGATPSTARAAVEGWAAEKGCWTYGTLSSFGVIGTSKCDVACCKNVQSDGCGHYTAIVSRRSTALGCGVATCASNGVDFDMWVCNYGPMGNLAGEAPY
jgi:pathogenesis-related protein 1